jgi:hypothetical protein
MAVWETAMTRQQSAGGGSAKQDLRSWIVAIEAADQLQRVSGAELDEEIGGIVGRVSAPDRQQGDPVR